jgi:hypothetical protein
MKSSWMPEAEHLACHWSEVGRSCDYDPSWCSRTQGFTAPGCRPFRISPAIVHLVEPAGFNPIPIDRRACGDVRDCYETEAQKTVEVDDHLF